MCVRISSSSREGGDFRSTGLGKVEGEVKGYIIRPQWWGWSSLVLRNSALAFGKRQFPIMVWTTGKTFLSSVTKQNKSYLRNILTKNEVAKRTPSRSSCQCWGLYWRDISVLIGKILLNKYSDQRFGGTDAAAPEFVIVMGAILV